VRNGQLAAVVAAVIVAAVIVAESATTAF